MDSRPASGIEVKGERGEGGWDGRLFVVLANSGRGQGEKKLDEQISKAYEGLWRLPVPPVRPSPSCHLVHAAAASLPNVASSAVEGTGGARPLDEGVEVSVAAAQLKGPNSER